MGMETFEIGTGRTRLTVAWQFWGPDLHVHIGGGDHHIGAVALVGTTPAGRVHREVARVPPHKEDRIVDAAAVALHKETGGNVCVTAGVHVDSISKEEIDSVLQTAQAGVDRLIHSLRGGPPHPAH
jgi:hypothetical protein